MKNFGKLLFLGVLFTLTATSCTETGLDLDEDKVENTNPQSTEGGDDEIPVVPTGG